MRNATHRNHTILLPGPSSSWVRKTLAESLRSRHPYSVNLLLGGYDPTSSEPHLYWIDYLGTKAKAPYAAQGYASYFCLSTMDRYHNPDGDLNEGLRLLRRCINELETRFIINLCVVCLLAWHYADASAQRQVQSESNRSVSSTACAHKLICLTDASGVREVDFESLAPRQQT